MSAETLRHTGDWEPAPVKATMRVSHKHQLLVCLGTPGASPGYWSGYLSPELGGPEATSRICLPLVNLHIET